MIPLNKAVTENAGEALENDSSFRPLPSNGICTRLGDKWTVQILWQLSIVSGRRLRFSALNRHIDGITQRMLTMTLRNLERDGLVVRHYYPEIPPRVEYELTELGSGILVALENLNLWLRTNMHYIDECRRAYDKAAV
ncbi:winged helix-turn-helix transcriptional regulator [Biostraticola tofi]|uniref:HxlR family transcriptional regulator n=1 Tax=Biostraticola tofi TaxID=466109 RepID=A0A4R3YW21_9GAMM|nr:helix-turn-helix domain-containing protein [Biostraticola tofi]TCV96790.1 HxlR family transcriptional regulator [Biostraticola tofi]